MLDDLTRESTVKVKGERGEFLFRYHVYNLDGTIRSTCVWGGTASHKMFRHFSPDRIIIPRPKRRTNVKAD